MNAVGNLPDGMTENDIPCAPDAPTPLWADLPEKVVERIGNDFLDTCGFDVMAEIADTPATAGDRALAIAFLKLKVMLAQFRVERVERLDPSEFAGV